MADNFYARYSANQPTTVVTSLNGMSGALTLVPGTNITIVPGAGTLTINATGSGANTFLSNLTAPTAINQDLLPDIPGGTPGRNLGSTALPWDTLFVTDIKDLSGISSIAPTVRQLNYATGITSIDWQLATLNDVNGVSLDYKSAGVIALPGTGVVARTLRFQEATLSGPANFVDVKAPDVLAVDTLFQYPPTNGTSGFLLQTDGTGITSWVSVGANTANTALSNLTATAINSSLIPGLDNTITLGSDTNRYIGAYIQQLFYSTDIAVDLNTKQLFDTATGLSVDWDGRTLRDSSGLTSVDWLQRQVLNTAGITTILWDNGAGGGLLIDATGNNSLNWENRTLLDSASIVSLNYTTKNLYDDAGVQSMDWDGRTLRDAAASTTVDFGSGTLQDPNTGLISVDWVGRTLKDSSNNVILSFGSNFTISPVGNSIRFVDGTQGTAGYTWTSVDTLGSGAWVPANTSSFITTTTTHAITLTDNIIYIDSSGGAFNLTLPDPTTVSTSTKTQVFTVIDIAGTLSTNNVTLVPFGAEKIEGIAASKLLQTDWGSYRISTNNVDWFIS